MGYYSNRQMNFQKEKNHGFKKKNANKRNNNAKANIDDIERMVKEQRPT